MLLNDFFIINSLEPIQDAPGKYEATVELNPAHKIFEGHFPSLPIAPGVCLVQMVKESTEQVLSKKLRLSTASNIKFMEMINPLVNPNLVLQLEIKQGENNLVQVNSSAVFENKVFFKFKGNFSSQ